MSLIETVLGEWGFLISMVALEFSILVLFIRAIDRAGADDVR